MSVRRRLGELRYRVGRAAAPRRWPGADGSDLAGYGTDQAALRSFADGAETDLEEVFYRLVADPGARGVTKWAHYLPVYDRWLGPWRGSDVGLLEIGVFQGGSLELWREFLGPEARITGIDIHPTCAGYVDPPNRVRIGSQDDPAFLTETVAELGRLDVVIDDGSHVGAHQRVSFDTLFPILQPGGLYVIEDLHTSYWYDYLGGRGRPGTGIALVKEIVDDLHGWYYDAADATSARDWIPAVHVYDSVAVIEKQARTRPRMVGGG